MMLTYFSTYSIPWKWTFREIKAIVHFLKGVLDKIKWCFLKEKRFGGCTGKKICPTYSLKYDTIFPRKNTASSVMENVKWKFTLKPLRHWGSVYKNTYIRVIIFTMIFSSPWVRFDCQLLNWALHGTSKTFQGSNILSSLCEGEENKQSNKIPQTVFWFTWKMVWSIKFHYDNPNFKLYICSQIFLLQNVEQKEAARI